LEYAVHSETADARRLQTIAYRRQPRLPPQRRAAANKSDNQKEQERADRCVDDCRNDTHSKVYAELRKGPSADEGSGGTLPSQFDGIAAKLYGAAVRRDPSSGQGPTLADKTAFTILFLDCRPDVFIRGDICRLSILRQAEGSRSSSGSGALPSRSASSRRS
jgi:hypothetical protein